MPFTNCKNCKNADILLKIVALLYYSHTEIKTKNLKYKLPT